MTYLCAAIFVHDVAQAKREIAAAAESGADMVELRMDEITDPATARIIAAECILPFIATCRPTWEGGRSQLDEEGRLGILEAAIATNARCVDVELETMRRSNRAAPFEHVIASVHDYQGRPARLHNLILELNNTDAEVNKIVWTARSIRDNAEVFDILKSRRRPTIALCMGEAGLISRVLAKKFGGFLTFAAPDGAGGTAPGQIGIAEMKRLYRWDAIGERTKVYGVVASPVMHSMSPAIHNAAFDATGFDGVYLPLLVEAGYESFKAFMETFVPYEGLDLSGLSVTIPHKENALRYLKEKGADIGQLAQTIGSVNTVIIDRRNGQTGLRGMNTDYAAILDSITARLGIVREQLAGKRVAVIGAGGTGRTAVAALAHYGADVTVYNRTKERAEELAREFDGHVGRVRAASLSELASEGTGEGPPYEVLLNATSVGMYPKVDESPVPAMRMGPQVVVFDSVYNPMRTKLLQMAEAAGARTIGGVEMFVRQAMAQFEAWTGLRAPAAVMRRVIEQRLRR